MDAVIEITRKLGEAIQSDERYIKYSLAREKNESDAQLQESVGKFNLLRMQLNDEIHKEDKDEEKIKSLNDELRACYDVCMSNPSMVEFSKAKAELDELVATISGLIDRFIDGADPQTCEPVSCGGNCSSCGGCH